MTLGGIFKLLHILAGFWFISGMLGRGATYRLAQQATDIKSAAALLQASAFFDMRMVRSGGGMIFLFGLLTAWLQQWPLFGFLQNARTNWLLLSIILYLAMLVPVPLVLLPRARQREKILADAVAAGTITPELTAALNDRSVTNMRTVELAGVLVIVALMVLKPF